MRRQEGRGQKERESDIVNRLELLPLDIVKKIALELSHYNVLNLCRVSAKLNLICSDWRFWRNKAMHDFNFPPEGFPRDINAAIYRYEEADAVNRNIPSLGMSVLIGNYYADKDTIMLRYMINKHFIPDDIILTLFERSMKQGYNELINALAKFIVDNKIELSWELASIVGTIGYSTGLSPEQLQLIYH